MRVEKELDEKLSKKYSGVILDTYETSINSIKINIRTRIAEFITLPKEEIKYYFKDLCLQFLKTCSENKIPYKLIPVLIIFDDEINKSVQETKIKPIERGFIYLPTKLFKVSLIYLSFAFLHELGHCWLDLEYKNHESLEFFADLLTMCIFERIVSTHEIYKDVIQKMSYIGRNEGKEYFGEELQKNIIEKPKIFLKYIMMNPKNINFENIKSESKPSFS